MGVEELEAIRKYVTENLKKGFITPSSIIFASLVLIVRRNRKLRFYVNYRRLNLIIKKNQYPILLVEELIERITRAKIFTKIDIR